MFDSVRNNKRVVQVILGLITLSFAFFGIESYISGSRDTQEVATVAGTSILIQSLDQNLREQQERIKNSGSPPTDLSFFKSAEFRDQVLDDLINQRVIALAITKANLTVPIRSLQDAILEIGAFQEEGKFSKARYDAVVRAQGMSQAQFEERLRQELTHQQMYGAIGNRGVLAKRSVADLLELQSEQRIVRMIKVDPARFVDSVTVSPEEISHFYNDNPQSFEIPVRVKVEYVALNAAALEKDISITEESIRKWYDEHRSSYATEEERRASHILIQVGSNATEEEIAKAKATATELRAKIGSNPERFSDLAKKYSQDVGTAPKGGDLGYFPRGVMVKPFEDTVFSLGENTVSDVIRSDFGFHVILLTGIKPSQGKSFDQVRESIAADLRKQAASKRFAETAEIFGNAVYEQSDSLTPVAERLKLEIVKSDWVNKGADNLGPYSNAKLLSSIFSDDVLVKKHNTEAIDVGNNTLVAARVIEHQSASKVSLDSASDQIKKQLVWQKAANLAISYGEKKLSTLRAGTPIEESWSAPMTLQRGSSNIDARALKAVFGVSDSSLPQFVGHSISEGGYVLISVDSSIKPSITLDDPRVKSAGEQLEKAIGRGDLETYIKSLRSRYEITINKTVLERLTANN